MTYQRPQPVKPVEDEHGDEAHPAFGMISAHRIRATPGRVLFDSDIRHNEFIQIELSTATRKRDLKHDWIHPHRAVFKVALSLAQFASFVSSTDTQGVPATIEYTNATGSIPGIVYAPRLATSMAETRGAAEEAFALILEAFQEYEEVLANKGGAKERAAALRTLRASIANAPANVAYAGSQLVKLTEDVVQKARADIEAMVSTHAATHGIESGEVLELLPGENG